jgi:hypothetical protein
MIQLILTLALIGFIVWAVTTYIPMPDLFRKGIYVITAIVVILYLMRVFGIVDIPLPR